MLMIFDRLLPSWRLRLRRPRALASPHLVVTRRRCTPLRRTRRPRAAAFRQRVVLTLTASTSFEMTFSGWKTWPGSKDATSAAASTRCVRTSRTSPTLSTSGTTKSGIGKLGLLLLLRLSSCHQPRAWLGLRCRVCLSGALIVLSPMPAWVATCCPRRLRRSRSPALRLARTD